MAGNLAGAGLAGAPGTSGAATGGAATGGSGIGGAMTGGAGGGGVDTRVTFERAAKPRVLVLTDISNEPDDEESLVRFLVYSNEYDVDGLIAVTSTWLKTEPRPALIRTAIDAYEQVRPALLVHASGFPSAEALRAVTTSGQPGYGVAAVGSGKQSAGSDLIIRAVDAADARPLWLTAWGGTNTLAQALSDVRASRTSAEVDAFVAKLRVYAISDQDDTGAWLRREFPNLFYVVSPSDQSNANYARATWTGISGDEHYDNGPGYQLDLVSNAWLSTNVRTGHGALGQLYPQWKYIMEGDTPAFLGLVDNGLGSSLGPGYGGWGGRYALTTPTGESRPIWTDSPDTFAYAPGKSATSNQTTIWRFRPDYQYDFAARMDWCVASTFSAANHNPVPKLNDDPTKAVMRVKARAGDTVPLSAMGTSDPDGNSVSVHWYIYPEAGTAVPGAMLSASEGLTTELNLKAGTTGTVHVILDAKDNGTPPLSAYRRVVVDVTP